MVSCLKCHSTIQCVYSYGQAIALNSGYQTELCTKNEIILICNAVKLSEVTLFTQNIQSHLNANGFLNQKAKKF